MMPSTDFNQSCKPETETCARLRSAGYGDRQEVTLSRKQFFRKGLFSLGDTLLKVSGMLQQPVAEAPEELSELPYRDQPMVAVSRNERCLARNCGCFSCVERCQQQAILVVMGEGISIDTDRCVGCGDCLYVCPVTPKAIGLVVREGATVAEKGA